MRRVQRRGAAWLPEVGVEPTCRCRGVRRSSRPICNGLQAAARTSTSAVTRRWRSSRRWPRAIPCSASSRSEAPGSGNLPRAYAGFGKPLAPWANVAPMTSDFGCHLHRRKIPAESGSELAAAGSAAAEPIRNRARGKHHATNSPLRAYESFLRFHALPDIPASP